MAQYEISRRERKKDETRERITQAAIELFTERGFEATTVDDIAAKADVAKGTFFNYFPRKESVFDALAEQKASEMEEVTAQPAGAGDPDAREAASLLRRDHDPSRLEPRAVADRSKPHAEPDPRPDPQRAGDLPYTPASDHRAGADLVELRRDVEAGRAAALIQGAAIGTMFAWFCADPGAFDLAGELQERLELILDGIAAPGGTRP